MELVRARQARQLARQLVRVLVRERQILLAQIPKLAQVRIRQLNLLLVRQRVLSRARYPISILVKTVVWRHKKSYLILQIARGDIRRYLP
ncbi:hypothetical protein Cha6605_3907 [Chamaesiphon minutus PCC 6605]|uniref:Uncharacterized protein n=1 Tax=Chamaesiphon minutus (strain ATCC 27169 / PCC 6605) TaxID=1173020 RepID=K9UJP8_CHAP6|nr:hypothetical protein Cha6605_3907 [Chamaesiphon minutus PCC 6605]